MREVPFQDAKSSLSTLIDEAIKGDPAVITLQGKPQAVLLGYDQWLRLSQVPSFARLLLAVPDAITEAPTVVKVVSLPPLP